MAICKKVLFYLLTIIFFFTSNIKAENSLNNVNLTINDFILMKYEIFFLKNQSRIINSKKSGLMVSYQSINYELKIDGENNTNIIINAVMDKNRYLKKKKYKPRISDCNIVRNKIVANKMGYSLLTSKPNYSVTEDVLFEYIKSNIFNIQNLNEDEIKRLIKKTTIKINIIHPISKFNINCSGKLSDAELY